MDRTEREAKENHTRGDRRPYEKPHVEIVGLLPKQTVLLICLTGSTGTGALLNGCQIDGTTCNV